MQDILVIKVVNIMFEFMKKKIVFFTLFLLVTKIYACDCKSVTIAEEYHVSDFVFIGDIIKKGNGYYFVKVKEVLKGDTLSVNSELKAFLGNCLINPEYGETWLIFATYSDGHIKISRCGNSTSFNRPFSFKKGFAPPPLPPGSPQEINILIKNSYESKAYNKLLLEISNLRSIRNNNEVLKIKTEINNKLNLIKWQLILIILLLLILIIIKIAKK